MRVSTQHQTARETRQAIDTLWENLVDESNPLFGLREIKDEDLREYEIDRIPFDFDALLDSSQDVNLGLEPPVLFHPLALSTLERHSIILERVRDNKSLTHRMDFLDYTPSTTDLEDDYREHRERAREVYNYLDAYSGCFFPRNGIPAPHMDLRGLLGVVPVSMPNPFLLGDPPFWSRPSYNEWNTGTILEYRKKDNVPVHPHVILMTMQGGIGKEDSMLIGELIPIITALRKRAHQPLMSEDEEEDLVDMDDRAPETIPEAIEAISRLPLAYEEETKFPILLVSLLGPQHGRLFYACMNGRKLVIRQSKLYSFEKKDTAPWDFFSRFILSRPLEEPSL